MRYIRFLKTPRIVPAKGSVRAHIYCLVTITSDLGDSFFPYDAELVAELIKPARDPVHPTDDDEDEDDEEILVWRTAAWGAGMRTLGITLPLKKSYALAPLRVRVGIEPRAQYDTLDALSQPDAHGIVSAWSAEFNANGVKEAVKLVERRFKVAQRIISVWEETGESIARHLWDAGILLSTHLSTLSSPTSPLSKALFPHPHPLTDLTILELGTGCGILGLTLASLLPRLKTILSDLPEAAAIVSQNILPSRLHLATGSTLEFLELNWDDELPERFTAPGGKVDVVLAADCTYNPDSSPALVATLRRLAELNSSIVVGIAMKMRHESERVFFELMSDARFEETVVLEFPLPGDAEMGAERVDFHVYRYGG